MTFVTQFDEESRESLLNSGIKSEKINPQNENSFKRYWENISYKLVKLWFMISTIIQSLMKLCKGTQEQADQHITKSYQYLSLIQSHQEEMQNQQGLEEISDNKLKSISTNQQEQGSINQQSHTEMQENYSLQNQDSQGNKQVTSELLEKKENTIRITQYFGIKNHNLSCYINVSLQLIWQIYCQDPTFLDSRKSELADTLCKLFQKIQQKQDYEQSIDQLKSLTNNTQNKWDDRGGDAYMSLITFFSTINQEEKQQMKKEKIAQQSQIVNFSSFYQIKFEEIEICQKCSKLSHVNKNDNKNISYDCSLHMESLQQFCINQKNNCFSQELSQCLICDKQFQLNRVITVFPRFLIIKFGSVTRLNQNKKKIKEFSFLDQNRCQIKYKLIGYCTFQNFHYTYTAFYNRWILFNDSYYYETNPNLSNVLFMLLQKL